jgi:hypothetical protein
MTHATSLLRCLAAAALLTVVALPTASAIDPRPLKDYQNATFAQDWEQSARPLYYKGERGDRSLWVVPQTMKAGTYVIFERDHGVPKLVEGTRVDVSSRSGDDDIIVPLPDWVKSPEILNQDFVSLPAGPASSFR